MQMPGHNQMQQHDAFITLSIILETKVLKQSESANTIKENSSSAFQRLTEVKAAKKEK